MTYSTNSGLSLVLGFQALKTKTFGRQTVAFSLTDVLEKNGSQTSSPGPQGVCGPERR